MKNINPAKKWVAAFVLLTLVLASVMVARQPVAAATGQICTQYGTTTQGNYTIMNNRWGTTATQCINVTTNGFQITQQDGTGNLSGAPVSYPAIYIGCHYSNCSPNTNLPMRISDISSANTSVNLTLTSSGTYDAAYDIWLNPTTSVSGVQASEIMIWLHRQGSIQPIGSRVGSANIAGRTWEVWSGNNGGNNVVSYVSSGITSFNADAKLFITDSFTRNSNFGNSSWYLTSMQMGFEPWIGGVGLAVNSFSATVSGGGSSNPTATRTPTQGTGPTATRTRTPTTGPTATRTRTPTQGTGPTATRTPTQQGTGPTATPTPGSGGGSTCSPVSATITAPFVKDGSGTFCWQSSNLGGYINSWNTTNVTVNGVNYTNLWAATSSLPAKINGYWYVSYNSTVAWAHFEAK